MILLKIILKNKYRILINIIFIRNNHPLLEINNKEILKNNILINIEFFDVGGIVKWYGISNKVTFSDGKIE